MAKKDENNVVVLMGVSSVDGVTPVEIAVNPITHRILVEMYPLTYTQPATQPYDARRDQNFVQTILAHRSDNERSVGVLVRSGRILVETQP